MAEQQDKKYLAIYRTWRTTLAILEPFREALVNIRDDLADEGDRVYFGSTNDADQFKSIAQTLDDIGWDEVMRPAHKDASDLYQELADANGDAARLHSEKMKFFEQLIATRTALKELVDVLAANDQDGLTEFAPQMQAARAALQPLS